MTRIAGKISKFSGLKYFLLPQSETLLQCLNTTTIQLIYQIFWILILERYNFIANVIVAW